MSGTATVSTKPDEAVIELGVRSQAADGQTAMQANAAKMSAVLKALGGVGVSRQDIETTRVSLDRSILARGTPHEQVLYVAQNVVRVTITDLDRVGAAIDAAVGAGADSVHDIRFQVSNPTEVRRRALQQAVRGARAKADAMAEAAGARVSGVISIREQGSPYQVGFDQAVPAALGAGGTPIVPQHEIQTRVTVSVVWSLSG